MSFVLKNMGVSHVDEVCMIEREVFRIPYSRKTVEDDMKNPMHRTVVAVNDSGSVAAYCMMSFVLDEAGLDRIAVKEKFRRCGVAQLLIEDMKNYCRNNKAAYIYLEVRRSNFAARSLYEKSGFGEVGVRKGYYSDNGEDAVLYTLKLT